MDVFLVLSRETIAATMLACIKRKRRTSRIKDGTCKFVCLYWRVRWSSMENEQRIYCTIQYGHEALHRESIEKRWDSPCSVFSLAILTSQLLRASAPCTNRLLKEFFAFDTATSPKPSYSTFFFYFFYFFYFFSLARLLVLEALFFFIRRTFFKYKKI